MDLLLQRYRDGTEIHSTYLPDPYGPLRHVYELRRGTVVIARFPTLMQIHEFVAANAG
jgi:hypothetical protein